MPRIQRLEREPLSSLAETRQQPRTGIAAPVWPCQCRSQPRASMNQRITAPLAATETTITSVARPLTDSTWVDEAIWAQILVRIEATGLKGFEPLTYRCPSDVPMERADKSRSLYLAKLQARGGAYWPSSVKRCAGARAPFKKAHGLTDVELEYL